MDRDASALKTEAESCGPGCDCAPLILPRRRFLALTGLTLAAAFDAARPVMAGPFEASDFEKVIPADKKLNPDWVRSLTERGERTVYSKERDELRYIGMPVGGICCGTLYLGGDGRLWLWDIFNENKTGILPRIVDWDGFGAARRIGPQDGSAYVAPHEEQSPLDQGFALKVNGAKHRLEASGWEKITFRGEYPLGIVSYADPAVPVAVAMTAGSPFLPLNADDSSLPATVCEFVVTNTSGASVQAEMEAWLENVCCRIMTPHDTRADRVNTARRSGEANVLFCHTERAKTPPVARPDIVVDDFERADYGDWTVEGTAFGSGPVLRKDIPAYQGDVGGEGSRVVNTHASAPGGSVEERDSHTGKLTSPPFSIERRYLTFYLGGGANPNEVGIRLLVDGKAVRQASGRNANPMEKRSFDVSEYVGQRAVIEIYDNGTHGWGNVGVDQIVQTDSPWLIPAEERGDFGSMALALIGEGDVQTGGSDLIGRVLTKPFTLAPGESKTIPFVVAWHFPSSGLRMVRDAASGNQYGARFKDAAAVADHVVREYPRLWGQTRLWHETWYDSTLPFWFLERTFSNTSILATTTCHRFATGRFWAWEGIGCCEGTCTHVWHYAQAVGRIFPELERSVREHVDFGVALDPKTGKIGFRGENTGPAVDGQCGRILGVYREHQMSANDAFLRRIWPRVREGMGFMLRHDSDGDGLIDGAQENTLDAAWFGKIAWISSLYAAALRACEEMATEVGDTEFAALCRDRFAQTRRALETELFNGEYFIQRPAPGHEKSIGTYQTCHIDQVHGQSWAWQVGLGRILDREKTVSALTALYKYNFAPDVGPYREEHKAGRAYALAGDAGLIMATNPKDLPDAFGNARDWQYEYFNECMSGFEHQAASHMIAEGLVREGLAVTRAVHDRYHAARRNPYNEIECSDHYSRSMASYGSFLTICGYEYHGPKGHIGFAPRLRPEDFKSPFTAAEGWGTYSQRIEAGRLTATIALRQGRLRLKTIALALPPGAKSVQVTRDGHTLAAALDDRQIVTLAREVTLGAGQTLTVTVG